MHDCFITVIVVASSQRTERLTIGLILGHQNVRMINLVSKLVARDGWQVAPCQSWYSVAIGSRPEQSRDKARQMSKK